MDLLPGYCPIVCKVWKHEWAFYLIMTQWLREILWEPNSIMTQWRYTTMTHVGWHYIAQVRWSIPMQREHIDDDDNDDDDDHYSDDEDDDDDDARFHGVAV